MDCLLNVEHGGLGCLRLSQARSGLILTQRSSVIPAIHATGRTRWSFSTILSTSFYGHIGFGPPFMMLDSGSPIAMGSLRGLPTIPGSAPAASFP